MKVRDVVEPVSWSTRTQDEDAHLTISPVSCDPMSEIPEFVWRERSRSSAIIGVLTGALECLACQVPGDVRKRIETVLEKAKEMESHANELRTRPMQSNCFAEVRPDVDLPMVEKERYGCDHQQAALRRDSVDCSRDCAD